MYSGYPAGVGRHSEQGPLHPQHYSPHDQEHPHQWTQPQHHQPNRAQQHVDLSHQNQNQQHQHQHYYQPYQYGDASQYQQQQHVNHALQAHDIGAMRSGLHASHNSHRVLEAAFGLQVVPEPQRHPMNGGLRGALVQSEQDIAHQHATSMQSQRDAANHRAASPPIGQGDRRFVSGPSRGYYQAPMWEQGQRLTVQTELPPASSGAPSAYPPTALESNASYGSPTIAFVSPQEYQSANLNTSYNQQPPMSIGRIEVHSSRGEPQPSSHRRFIYDEAGPSRPTPLPPTAAAMSQSLAPPTLGATTSGSSAVMELDSPAVRADTFPPTRAGSQPNTGAYSKTGFNVLPFLAAVVNRDNSLAQRKVELGPVDLGCAFVVVDCQEADMPIVYANESFSLMTRYALSEISRRNCRFLQSPEGVLEKNGPREATELEKVQQLVQGVGTWDEIQLTITNYRKGGERFTNLLTIIPIRDPLAPAPVLDPNGPPRFLVGFQIDVTHSYDLNEQVTNGSYAGDFHLQGSVPRGLTGNVTEMEASGEDLREALGTKGDAEAAEILLAHNTDFVVSITHKGKFLCHAPGFERLLGWSRDDVRRSTLLQLCHPADRAALERNMSDNTITKTPFKTGRLLFRMTTGPGYTTHTGVDASFVSGSGGERYVWVDCAIRRHLTTSRDAQPYILSGRLVSLPPPLPPCEGLLAWAMLDARGIVLVVGPKPLGDLQLAYDAVSSPTVPAETARPTGAGPGQLISLSSPSQTNNRSAPIPARIGTSLVPAIGHPFCDVALPNSGRETLRQLLAQPNRSSSPVPDTSVTLSATKAPAVVSLRTSQGGLSLAVIREQGALAPDSDETLVDALDQNNPRGWRMDLGTLQAENARLRAQLESKMRERADGSVLGKRESGRGL